MRLLADENISWRLKKLLPNWDILPANEIKSDFRLTDRKIWDYAKVHHYCILTFDEDFIELQNLYSSPPKIIWMRSGNLRTEQISDLLLRYESVIAEFIDDSKSGICEIR